MDEPTQIGISTTMHPFLQSLKENGFFSDMTSAYQFAIAIAIKKRLIPKELIDKRNVFAVVTVDPGREIHTVIKHLYPDLETPYYTLAERLADAGLRHMYELESGGRLDLYELIQEVT